MKIFGGEIPYLATLVMLFYFVDLEIKQELILAFPFWFGLGIFIFCRSGGLISKFLRIRAVQFLGKISYSIYLNHFFVLWVIHFIFWKVLKLEASQPGVWISFISTLGVTIVYSFFTQRFIEVKLGGWLRDKIN